MFWMKAPGFTAVFGVHGGGVFGDHCHGVPAGGFAVVPGDVDVDVDVDVGCGAGDLCVVCAVGVAAFAME